MQDRGRSLLGCKDHTQQGAGLFVVQSCLWYSASAEQYDNSVSGIHIEVLSWAYITNALVSTVAGSGASYSFWYTSRKADSPYFALHCASGTST